MITLINSNRMMPAIAPVGVDYVATAARRLGATVEVLDLALAADPQQAIAVHFAANQPELVGISFRNVDDCFWPSGASFLSQLRALVDQVRCATDAPIVVGGVGFSIFAQRIVALCGADFGIRGDGERALVQLHAELCGDRQWAGVAGLIWRDGGALRANAPAWPAELDVPTSRDAIDNRRYFQLGGQIGIETKRGCPRRCVYCADRLAKGDRSRLRDPEAVADEVAALLAQGCDVLHICDSEFNLPPQHATAVCQALVRRGLHRRVRWYAYLAVVPFDASLAECMAKAGCAGINFTSDAAHPAMLARYRQPHQKADLGRAVQLCRKNGIAVMLDMLLGGPGETPETLAETVRAFQEIAPDCAGAGLGIRIYPGMEIESIIAAEGAMETNPSIRRHYTGPIDLVRPTFYIASALGANPARLVRELIGDDKRFFPPEEEAADGVFGAGDHNYNANQALTDAIAAGARGAYWDILRQMR